MTTVKEAIIKTGESLPAKFVEEKNDLLRLEYTVAERKSFLNKQRLTYRCKVKINDDKKMIKFFEILSEVGSGISSGGYDGDSISSGFGFKAEKTKYTSGVREGSIEEQSVLFGKKYNYDFDYKKIRQEIKNIVDNFGYDFEMEYRESALF
ncbi:MAG: ribonucleoside-triphosphate reductase [Actinobacteria bacterium]|nr:ribonucleoside-triphosphate reductase [Actinomycetota bacterium]